MFLQVPRVTKTDAGASFSPGRTQAGGRGRALAVRPRCDLASKDVASHTRRITLRAALGGVTAMMVGVGMCLVALAGL